MIRQRGMGINYKGSQGQTLRAVMLQEEEDAVLVYRLSNRNCTQYKSAELLLATVTLSTKQISPSLFLVSHMYNEWALPLLAWLRSPAGIWPSLHPVSGITNQLCISFLWPLQCDHSVIPVRNVWSLSPSAVDSNPWPPITLKAKPQPPYLVQAYRTVCLASEMVYSNINVGVNCPIYFH